MEKMHDKDLVPFMEKATQSMARLPVSSICVIARLEDDAVFTQFYHSTMMDKLIFAGVIQQDATRDTLNANKESAADR